MDLSVTCLIASYRKGKGELVVQNQLGEIVTATRRWDCERRSNQVVTEPLLFWPNWF